MGFPQSCTGTERAGAEPHGHGAVPLSCVCPTSWCPSYCPVFILLLSACPIVWCPSYCPVSVPLPGVHPTAQCLCHCPWFILLPGVHPTAQCPSHCPGFILLPGVCPRARCPPHCPVSVPVPGVCPCARCPSRPARGRCLRPLGSAAAPAALSLLPRRGNRARLQAELLQLQPGTRSSYFTPPAGLPLG